MNRRTLRIQITKTGVLFIALCLGIGLAGLNTGNNLLYLIFSMMLSFLLLSGILSNSTLRRLRISASFPNRIFAGEPVPVRMDLENRKKLFPSFCLTLRSDSTWVESRDSVFVPKISPVRPVKATSNVRFPNRGRMPLPEYRVETTYPFGLIRKNLLLPSSGETVVYPRRLLVEPLIAASRSLSGEFLSGLRGGETNPWGIRHYVHGDAARLIHWKTSARQGSLKVKEFEREKRPRILLETVLARAADSDPIWLELAVAAAASFLTLFASRGHETKLHINGEAVAAEGHRYVDTYLTALALARPPKEPTRLTPASTEFTRVIVTDSRRTAAPPDCAAFFGPDELAGLRHAV